MLVKAMGNIHRDNPLGLHCIGCNKISFTSAGLRKNAIMWKILREVSVNVSLWEIPRPKNLGPAAPWVFGLETSLGDTFTIIQPPPGFTT